MPELVPDHIPDPRTPLVWDGTRYRAIRGYTDGTVQVRGEDQLHSYKEPLTNRNTDIISGANGSIVSNSPADGVVWHITHITTRNRTSATTATLLLITTGGVICALNYEARVIGANEYVPFKSDVWLEHDDVIHTYFIGGLVGDNCDVDLIGEVFTKE